MVKVEAPTLEAAYIEAAKKLNCSISELQYEIIQHPSKGVMGLFKKSAIIVAECKSASHHPQSTAPSPQPTPTNPSLEESVAKEIVTTVKAEEGSTEASQKPVVEQPEVSTLKVEDDAIVNGFFDEEASEEKIIYDELARLIEDEIKHLMELSCFDIDVVEVDVVDNTALIFIDGEDAALLIGKEGYRYNALSYMLFNWLHSKYELFIKLEIAEFLTTQQEMIRSYIQPVIENVEKHGRGKTRYLDGILVQIALEQLREAFPNKYVAVKTAKDGGKFVVINDFNSKPNA